MVYRYAHRGHGNLAYEDGGAGEGLRFRAGEVVGGSAFVKADPTATPTDPPT